VKGINPNTAHGLLSAEAVLYLVVIMLSSGVDLIKMV
jgi:hypothetical protein